MDAVQMEVLEGEKENIQPRASGRSAKALSEAYSSSKPALMAQRRQLEEGIELAMELDDPLEPYLQYIGWLHDVYPQGHNNESGLITVLEKCVEDLYCEQMYKTDARFLKVWLELAQYHDQPLDVFKFMIHIGVGQNLALFYEEYASFLEKCSKIPQARAVYEKGISLKARPVTRLTLRFEEFVARNPNNNNGATDTAVSEMSSAPLTLKLSIGKTLTTNDNVPYYAQISTGGNNKIAVFRDAEGINQAQSDMPGSWSSIGSIAQRKKENSLKAQAWSGQTLPSTVPSKRKGISVFRDGTNKEQKLAVAIGYLQDENGDEISIEELLVKLRGLQGKTYPRIADPIPLRGKFFCDTILRAITAS